VIVSGKLPPVIEFLKRYQGARVFFEPLWGNNGDTLIRMGALRALQQAKVICVRSPNRADLIVINGGSGLTHLWGRLHILEQYCRRFPQTPLVVLPSSWDCNPDEINTLVRTRAAPCFLYARERYSFELLKGAATSGRVVIGLDHDMAFHLKDSPYLTSLSRAKDERHVLIVERSDVESATGAHEQPSRLVRLIQRVVPSKLRHALPQRARLYVAEYMFSLERIFNMLQKPSASGTEFVREALKIVEDQYPQYRNLPIVVADISLKYVRSFRRFCLDIARAAIVVTTRLHVGILAALLGKPTYIKPGNWHKIVGVYEYSLIDFPNVRLLP